ncbi:hypothetical protein B0H12DRAFT_1240699 [Mycena haematopus]|nr:hypothetical protein B0H12DRAFT_1240699 [Mycena haematopus]
MICETLTLEPTAELSLQICALPPELLARILKLLAYFDILRASMVCKQWNELVGQDPEIAQLLYKRTCRSIADDSGSNELDGFDGSGDRVVAIVRECLVIDSPVMTLPTTDNVTDEMVNEALCGAFTPDGKRRGRWLNKADCLEVFRRYEGLEATRNGLRANSIARLGLQPVAGEFF